MRRFFHRPPPTEEEGLQAQVEEVRGRVSRLRRALRPEPELGQIEELESSLRQARLRAELARLRLEELRLLKKAEEEARRLEEEVRRLEEGAGAAGS